MMIWRCLVAISLAILASTSLVDAQPAASYTYDLIVQQPGFPVGPARLAINSGGDVAYQFGNGDIFKSNGVTQPVSIGVGKLGGINTGGEVAFINDAATQVAKSDGTTTTIIETESALIQSADINDAGTVVFSTPSGVFTGNGGPVTTVAALGHLDVNGRAFIRFYGAGIAANGAIVFKADTDDDGHFGIFLADGPGAPTVLVDTQLDMNQPLETQYDAFGDPVISAGGNVAMWAESYAFTDGALFVPAGGTAAWHFYDAVGGAFGVLDSLSPNDHGRIVMELAHSPLPAPGRDGWSGAGRQRQSQQRAVRADRRRRRRTVWSAGRHGRPR